MNTNGANKNESHTATEFRSNKIDYINKKNAMIIQNDVKEKLERFLNDLDLNGSN